MKDNSRFPWLTAIVVMLLLLLAVAYNTPSQQTFPVNSGPLTDTQLRASAVPVSGPVTDAQMRASAVPVSGPLTDAQLRATAVPISGTVTALAAPLSGCGGTNYDSGIITLPNSTTVLTGTSTCVSSITLINLTGVTQTITITDGQGSPANLIPPSFQLGANGDVVFNRSTVRAISGIKWSATNSAAVAGWVRGNQ